jgi:predicted DNA-binding transcriptional regulator AlpA
MRQGAYLHGARLSLMSEPSINPFEPLIDAIAEAVVKKLASQNGHRESKESEDRLLDATEAAKMLSMSEDWLYRHAKKLPFTRKLGPKTLRFSYQGIVKWMATRKLS